MRASSLVAPVLLVTLSAGGMLGCESTTRDPIRPIDRSASTASVRARVSDCLPADPNPDPNAPVAVIVNPPPSIAFVTLVPPDFTVTWSGHDADGRVREYRFRLFGRSNPDFPDIYDFVDYVLSNPRVLEDFYGPCFGNWDSARPHVTSHAYTGLQPNERYLFAIMAFDNDGKHDPVQFGRNLLTFGVTFPQFVGPRLSFSSGSWSYTYPSGGYLDDPSRYVDLAVMPGEPVTVQWSARPLGATPLEGYRWGLDLPDLGRDGPRGSGTPPGRWTDRRLSNTWATVGPFGPGETHLLYVDVTDTIGFASLGIVRLNVTSGGVGPLGLQESGGSR